MGVLALSPNDRFSVEGGRSPSEERPSQMGGERAYRRALEGPDSAP
jgi:hypothetical protein